MTSIPFDPPKLLRARRIMGFVDVPESNAEEDWTGRKAFSGDASTSCLLPEPEKPRSPSLAGPTLLKREKTMAGNIVVFEPEGSPSKAFWLSRKIGRTSHADFRLGYQLRPNTKPDAKESGQGWELDVGENEETILVKIMILHSSVLGMKSDGEAGQSPLDVLSALQMIAQHIRSDDAHVVGTDLVGTCQSHIYAVLPYFPNGNLLDYCLSRGNLEEPVARYLFCQILKGLHTLQETGLCHRNLSLEVVKFSGEDKLVLSGLDCCLRFQKNAPIDEDKPIPLPGGTNPQFVAPEYFGTLTSGWDGFAADLWAGGLMLYCMVVGVDALFHAPIQEDKTFSELCIKGNVGSCVQKFAKNTGRDIVLSDELLDLLGNMLISDPKRRYSLEQVMDHAWVKDGNFVAPSALNSVTAHGSAGSDEASMGDVP